MRYLIRRELAERLCFLQSEVGREVDTRESVALLWYWHAWQMSIFAEQHLRTIQEGGDRNRVAEADRRYQAVPGYNRSPSVTGEWPGCRQG